jgi:hypothetical protein
MAQDNAGQAADAVATWSQLQAADAARRLRLWTPGIPCSDWPPLAPVAAGATPVAFLYGPPGSAVERVALMLRASLPAFRDDRFSRRPPADPFQRYTTITALEEGTDPAAVVAEWRDALPARGVANGQVVDWLVFWDNALLHALRPQLPQATLLVAVRDPRDMLLDWLAFGAPAPMAMASPVAAAQWLATVLHQLAALHEQDLLPHQLLRLDDAVDDPQALAAVVGTAIGLELPPSPPQALGPRRFPAGHWRMYADALAEPFALLTPVARRLGYEAA